MIPIGLAVLKLGRFNIRVFLAPSARPRARPKTDWKKVSVTPLRGVANPTDSRDREGRRGEPDPAAPAAIDLVGLHKVYDAGRGKPGKEALRSIDLTIGHGELFGLLGPNGAGKSTLINVLAGLVLKTAGKARICGFDIDVHPRNARAAIGVVPQELSIDPFFTPRESLDLQAGLYGVPKRERRTEKILRDLFLTEVADAYSRRLSGGMKRRLMVAKAMVHAPPVIVLDEPTAGVDVELRQYLWSYIRDLNAVGTTILLTTHYLEEAEQLCDRIAIIDKGDVVACDKTNNLVRLIDRKEVSIVLADDLDAVPASLSHLNADLRTQRTLVVRYRRSDNEISEILASVQRAGLTILDLTTEESDLEDVFLELTGREGLRRLDEPPPPPPGRDEDVLL
jgi:ABC-2 type transport system ATP-binding protein